MKTIRINTCGHDPIREDYTRFIIGRINRLYNIEFSDSPEYVLFHERDFGWTKYPQAVRILLTGENIHPNLNLHDYSVSFDFNDYDGRNFRFPVYLVPSYYYEQARALGEDPDFEMVRPMDKNELNNKTGFCSFVYGNGRADPRRLEFLDMLSQYKRVNSGGTLKNNTGKVTPVPEKFSFERKHKFSIAFENSSRSGYVTEKLPGALAARTIPIYFGDPDVGRQFNTERFINVHEFADFKSVIERVKEIDSNDNEYLRIVNQPILPPGHSHEKVREELDKFLQKIFDQRPDEARRIKINSTHRFELEQKEILYSWLVSSKYLIRRLVTLPKKYVSMLHRK